MRHWVAVVVALAAVAATATNALADGLPVSATPSKAPIVRLAGTGVPGAWSSGATALQTTLGGVDGVANAAPLGYHLLFTDHDNNRVFFLSNGHVGLFAGSGSSNSSDGDAAAAGISSPTGVALYDNGIPNVRITSRFQLGSIGGMRNWIQLTNSIGTEIAMGGLKEPWDLSLDPSSGYGYIADHLDDSIKDTDNATIASGLDPPTDVALIDASTGTFLFTTEKDQGGNVWQMTGAGTPEAAITQLSGDGTVTDNGAPAPETKLLYPQSIATLADGGYLVYDSGHRLLRRVVVTNGTALIATLAGNGTDGLAVPGTPADEAPLTFSADMALTSDGLVFSQTEGGTIEMVPATAITAGPDALTTSRNAAFTLASWDSFAAYQCTLDSQAPVACASGDSFDGLADGPHTMSVKATTNGGTMVDASPAIRTWTVDGTPPSAFDLVAPADQEVTGSTSFNWRPATDSGPGDVNYELLIDGAKADAATVTCDSEVCRAALAAVSDGAHTWQVKARDEAGNITSSAARTFTERQPPTAALSVSPNPVLAGRTVTFDASKSNDPNGQITGYAWDLDGDGNFETDSGASPSVTKSFATPTTLTVQVRVTDSGSNTAVASGKLVVTSTPPAGKQLGVSINDGAQFTNDPNVTVFAVWPSFASDALVSNDGGFKSAKQFPVAEKTAWTLDSSGPERLPKTIYVRFIAGERVSETYQDDIILDQTPPKVLSASFAPGARSARAAAAKKVTLKLKATDNVSGVSGVQVTTNKRKPGAVLKYKKTLKVKPAKTMYVRVRDRAGNFSAWRTAKRR